VKRSRLAVTRCAAVVKQLVFLSLIVTAYATVTPVYAFDDGKESVDVTCYKKDDEGSISIGNVTITRAVTAAVNCNATYVDCKDKCIGCFYDQNLGETVCYNAAQEKVPQ